MSSLRTVCYNTIFACLAIGPCRATSSYATSALHPFFLTRYERIDEEIQLPHKATTVLLYIAGRNDLDRFVRYNLSQLESIGTNNNITFLIDLHTIQKGVPISQRFIVYKNRLVQVGNDKQFDSGSAETLISACTWAFTHFPADTKVLILWNHGTGGLEPDYRTAVNPAELYTFNPKTNLIELNRTIGFMDYLELCNTAGHRGICFDNATKRYLSNRDVGQALRTVCNTCFNGQPFDIVSCDACLMAGIEPIYSLKPRGEPSVARYFVASQEVVLATGYPYNTLFAATAANPQNAEQLARHFVAKFAQHYLQITQDYTQSAIDMSQIELLYDAIDLIAQLLITGMKQEANNSVHNLISICSSKDRCTHFDEPSYKDMYHLFDNMRSLVSTITLTNAHDTRAYREQLATALTAACTLLKRVVIVNAAGRNLAQATGLSIYLPAKHMHSSYAHTDFGSTSQWTAMLRTYLNK